MKLLKILLVLALSVGIAGVVLPSQSIAQRGYGMHQGMMGGGYGQDGDWSYCPYCGDRLQDRGGYGMGPGMMGPGYDRRGMGPGMMGPGYDPRGMGPGMMGPGYDRRGMGPGMMGPGYGYPDDPRYGRPMEPMNKEKAEEQVKTMLQRSRNPNLKLGDVKEKEGSFEVDILTKGGDLVDKMQVDKQTGLMRSIY